MTEAYEIEIYKTSTGKEPYIEWEVTLIGPPYLK